MGFCYLHEHVARADRVVLPTPCTVPYALLFERDVTSTDSSACHTPHVSVPVVRRLRRPSVKRRTHVVVCRAAHTADPTRRSRTAPALKLANECVRHPKLRSRGSMCIPRSHTAS